MTTINTSIRLKKRKSNTVSSEDSLSMGKANSFPFIEKCQVWNYFSLIMPGGVAAEKKQLRISFPDFFSGGGGGIWCYVKKNQNVHVLVYLIKLFFWYNFNTMTEMHVFKLFLPLLFLTCQYVCSSIVVRRLYTFGLCCLTTVPISTTFCTYHL